MYGYNQLKKELAITDTEIECPVLNCHVRVPRQREKYKKEDIFRCQEHNIFISPSTFEYADEHDNLLWHDKSDKTFFENILKVKRECRIARENSEDAVTYNIFQFLRNNDLLDSFLSFLSKEPVKETEMILWSYHEKSDCAYSLLNKARIEFGESINRGSEPDIILLTDKTLFFVEAKVTALNETTPGDIEKIKKYLTGGDNWYYKVFREDYKTIALEKQKYELLRFWLLGTWMANQIGRKFNLISLVLEKREKDIETEFAKVIIEDHEKQFQRISWEYIYNYINSTENKSGDFQTITDYFKYKCLGYDYSGNLVKAFSL